MLTSSESSSLVSNVNTGTKRNGVVGVVLVLLLVAGAVGTWTSGAEKGETGVATHMEVMKVAEDGITMGGGAGSTYNIEIIGTNFNTLSSEIKTRGCPCIAHVANQGRYNSGGRVYFRSSECVVTSTSITVTAMGQDRTELYIVEVSVGQTGLATVKSEKFNSLTNAKIGNFNLKSPNPTYPAHDVYYAVFTTAAGVAPTTNVESVKQWANLFKGPAQLGFEASNGDLTIMASTFLVVGGNGYVQYNWAAFPVASRKVDGSGMNIRVVYGYYGGSTLMQCTLQPYDTTGTTTSTTTVGNGYGLTNNNIVGLSGTPKCKIGDVKFYVDA